MITKSGSHKNAWVDRFEAADMLELQAKWLRGMSGEIDVKVNIDMEIRLRPERVPPKCPECGRDMLDDEDGMYGGWICASGHPGVVIYD